MPVSFYEVAWIFVIYSFLGWCTEVAYAALDTGKFVNRGFLNGPICPVYGCGILAVIVVLTPLKEHFLVLFFGSILLTTPIEFLTGFLLEKIFHNQWWDYSDEPFNLCGYVCLKFSILWGIACTLILDVLHPTISNLIRFVPEIPGIILLIILCIILAADLILTVSTILKINHRLSLIDELTEKLKGVSDGIGGNIYEGVNVVVEKGDSLKESVGLKATQFTENHEELVGNLSAMKNSLAEKREDFAESFENFKFNLNEKKEQKELKREQREQRKDIARMQARYHELLESRSFGDRRLLKAFPGLRSKGHQEALSKWKKFMEEKKEK